MKPTDSGWRRTGSDSAAPVIATIQGGAPTPHIYSEGFSLLPDTHAHLDVPEFGDDLEAVLTRAHDAGVDRILAVGSDLATSRMAVELAGRYAMVYAAVGIHPHRANLFVEEQYGVETLLREDKVVAVGEIGLDYFRQGATREEQRAAFDRQLRWAREMGLPVSVHNREADEDILAALDRARVCAVLHCFSGTRTTADRALGAGHLISFAGNVTFPRAEELREVAAMIPKDRILVETDAPVLAPQPHRGRRNEPAYVAITARMLASLRSVSPEVLAATVSETADRLFRWRDQ